MISLQASEICQLLGGVMTGPDVRISAVSTDSRTIAADSLFIALKGPNFDGANFIADVATRGAAHCCLAWNKVGRWCVVPSSAIGWARSRSHSAGRRTTPSISRLRNYARYFPPARCRARADGRKKPGTQVHRVERVTRKDQGLLPVGKGHAAWGFKVV